MFTIFLNSLLVGYSGAIMPGPMFTYTIDKSLKHGSKSGILASIGHALLEMLVVILIFAGASRLLSGKTVQITTGLIGGLVLGYMGFSMLRDTIKNKISLSANTDNNDQENSNSNRSIVLAGIVLSITSPYFFIWWTAVGLALIMNAYNAFGIMGITVFYIGHILSDITWFSFISVLISKTRRLINIKIYKAITALLALFLLWFGINFIIGSIKLIML
jgi:threonine/homoserine/homoserine lactone efflux protein